jgi:polyribonucleotide nucleotidyltransferase
MPVQEVSIDFNGKKFSLTTGKYAKFANGAVMVRCEDTMVLVTATRSDKEIDADFLPLQVEYREKTASAGKIPGGFLKREGRPSDKEILTARLIDRPIRPLLPKSWRYETQIVATVYSSDPAVEPDTLAAVGASAAMLISDIPYAGPISEVNVGRINGEFIVNPSFEEAEKSDIYMTVAGSESAILMVEGESKEISEDEFLEAIDFAHEKIKELNKLQMELHALAGVEKTVFTEKEMPEDVINLVKETISEDIEEYIHKGTSKEERGVFRTSILEKAMDAATAKFGEDEELAENLEKYVGKAFSDFEKERMRRMILSEKVRLDGRKLDEIRPIACEVGLLPRTHGSALFTRGETQSLSTVTLGTSRDEQMIDGLQPTYNERFMLHYNFPPFSTGETGRMGVSRREVGHGHLAWRAIKSLLPSATDFPYTIRIVSDILESNGSSSMATVCAGSLSLFDAGVPMKKSIAGIAMGLIKEDNEIAVLSDILGDEDFLGDMDFKVTGTKDGITAYQMDIKIDGLSVDIMKTALEQAKAGRDHILGIMDSTISETKDDISQYAPRYESMKVPTDMIAAVIGSGGETIRAICKETNTEINIEDDGTILIAATSKEESDAAREMIEKVIRKPEEGEVYLGTVKELREGLGAFVEILPKTSGLLHISQIAYERVEDMSQYLTVGEKIEVKLLEVTRDGKYRLSRKALLPKPEGYVEREDSGNRDRGRRDDRRRDDRRGGGGGRDRRR